MKALILLSIISSIYALTPTKIQHEKGYQMVTNKKCHLHIAYGSYGSGTPYDVEKKIDQYIKKHNFVERSFYWVSGLEGETDHCLILKEIGEVYKHFFQIKKLIPQFSKKGYTTLKDNKGNIHKTTWPK